ncbi:SDR family NAD(P)-dependent oxidoreductase [Hoeflea sp. G2-23]|uniref:SDR family NAD(P)-dependent oxidoreductase n=1 Tax=Hoeflea algicola TaxID=2983763 RepID=A0ABT3ZDF1_9HYPH|nr:SDR family NAD(P)-dependent oxidoreductase [Hoeflea algicola]MCY0149815.1 SDR family NAD(P)-dependent oxidoreductase [Hoeflea algicola]
MTKSLTGKVALVTGAGRGIGRAIADHLASQGCSIAIHGMRENGPSEYGEGRTLSETAHQISNRHDIRTMRVLADLTDPLQARALVATVEQELGPLDILVHNAGGDISAAGGKPDPNDCVHIVADDVSVGPQRS